MELLPMPFAYVNFRDGDSIVSIQFASRFLSIRPYDFIISDDNLPGLNPMFST